MKRTLGKGAGGNKRRRTACGDAVSGIVLRIPPNCIVPPTLPLLQLLASPQAVLRLLLPPAPFPIVRFILSYLLIVGTSPPPLPPPPPPLNSPPRSPPPHHIEGPANALCARRRPTRSPSTHITSSLPVANIFILTWNIGGQGWGERGGGEVPTIRR